MKPKLLDLFCCQGGASEGYSRAGFDVYGVDIDNQPRYRFPFLRTDAVEIIDHLAVTADDPDGPIQTVAGFYEAGTKLPEPRLEDEDAIAAVASRYVGHFNIHEFDALHASPPCQAHTNAQKIMGNDHPDFIEPIRAAFEKIGKPWVIENVVGAPLRDPIMLCGPMFGLETYRHRLFESNVHLTAPEHAAHTVLTTKMGRTPRDGEYMHVVGNFSGVDRAREVMDMPWATRDGLREAIPPAYTEHIGRQLIRALAPS